MLNNDNEQFTPLS